MPSHAVCLEAHDLVVSKLVAGREKDFEFATALIRADLVDPEILLQRADLLPVPGAVVRRVRDRVDRRASERREKPDLEAASSRISRWSAESTESSTASDPLARREQDRILN